MLVIGILIGTFGVIALRTPEERAMNANSNSTEETVSTIQTEGANFAPATTTIAQSGTLPILPQIPENTRVGLSVMNQPAGMRVDVTGLVLTTNQWVAVYDDRDGRPSSILGAGRVWPQATSTVIELLRPMLAKGKYYAALLQDDGDDSFNRLTDLPPLSPERVIIVSFLAE